MKDEKPEPTDSQKIENVKEIFNNITPHYDRMNRIMSGRRDVYWRRFLVSRLPKDAHKVLDVATGTADVAIEVARRRPGIEVTGLDFVQKMLDIGLEKVIRKGLQDRIRFINGDAMNLPFPDDTFDTATIAFGMRNIPDRRGAIKEMMRVVRPGGKVLVLEMTFPRNLKMRRFFDWYLNRVIPLLGSVITGNLSAYKYLSDSIHNFIHPDELKKIFEDVGLKNVQTFPLTMGITYLHEGVVE
jgi:demethylmenaquinone methyltransferase/2-methoxy-6-polyprenyl-1,4-benzoquinol methylase